MPQASRRLKRERRTKRRNSILTKSLKQSYQQAGHTLITLFAVLAQHGGRTTVTQGTYDQVRASLSRLSFQIVEGSVPGEFIVNLHEAPPIESATTPAFVRGGFTMRTIEDEGETPVSDVPAEAPAPPGPVDGI